MADADQPSGNQPVERKIVVHPRTSAARRLGRSRSVDPWVRGWPAEPHAVERLVAEQRRLALSNLALLVVPFLILPLVFFTTDLGSVRLGPLPPLAWVILGPGVFPFLLWVGERQRRAAERVERTWIERQT